MSQPESTERCEVCGRPVIPPAVRCWGPDLDCYRLGYGRVSRALAEAEKEIAQAREEREKALATAEDYAAAARAAEERAAQAERARALVDKWAAQPCIQRNIRLSGKVVHPDCPNTPRRKGAFCLSCQARKALSVKSTTHRPQPASLQEAAKGRAPEAPSKQTCVRCQGRGFRTAPPGGSMRCEDCEGFGWISGGAQGEEK